MKLSLARRCPRPLRFLTVLAVLPVLLGVPAPAGAVGSITDVPIGGFQPWVAFTATDQFANENQDDLFFVADVDTTYNAADALPTSGNPQFAVALLDSGSQVNLLQWQTMLDFDLPGAGFTGTEFIPAQGVSGTELLRVEDPLGLFAAGLQHAAGGAALSVPNTTELRGLTSNAPATAPIDSQLPNVVGLPTLSSYMTVIRNSQPNFTTVAGKTYRAPSVELLDKAGAVPGDFSRRAGLALDVAPAFGTTEPVYVFNLNNILSGDPLHENPSTPTAVGGAFFTDITLTGGGNTQNAEVFFDTGAQVSVVNELLAAQLGFDVVNDTPAFTVPILGVGGTLTEIPGFYADSLTLPAVGGNFTATHVPIIVLDEVPNPKGTGILDGILGTNVFWDRDLAIDPAGSRLWISDAVTTAVTWNGGVGSYDTAGKWSVNRRPVATDIVTVAGSATVNLATDAEVFRLLVGGSAAATPSLLDVGTHRLDVFTSLNVEQNGTVSVAGAGFVDAQEITVQDGGTLTGSGTFASESITNNGTVRALGSALTLVGTYQQNAGGRLQYIDAKLVVDGGAILAGELDVSSPTSGTRPAAYTTVLTILEADAIAGTFGTVTGVSYGDGFGLAVTYLADAVHATVALLGDADLDGFIAQADLDAVLLNWGDTGATWVTGDFDGDGFIAQADLDAVLLNWGATAEPNFAGSNVPEPATLLPVLAALAWRRRRVSLA